jgi:hypothetical protein
MRVLREVIHVPDGPLSHLVGTGNVALSKTRLGEIAELVSSCLAIFSRYEHQQDDGLKLHDIDGTCNMHGKDKKCIQNVVSRPIDLRPVGGT